MKISRHLLSRYAKSIDSVFITITHLGIEVYIYYKGVIKTGKVKHPKAKVHPNLNPNLILP